MIEITPSLKIDERELQIDFMRASGPGGQNVNKVASAVQLRFDVRASSLPEDVKARLTQLAGKRVTDEGILLIEAKRFRTQEQNRADAIQRFVELVRKSLVKPKARKKTKPTQASKEVRLKEKKRRGAIKKIRQSRSVERD
jgi:ribosome-associated protein